MKRILFLCVANSARSQIAEALAKNIWPHYHIQSAGSLPSGQVNPIAIEAMSLINIQMDDHYSKRIDELPQDFLSHIDLVITLCAEESCPILPHSKAQILHWPYPDPKTLGDFITIRDHLKNKLLNMNAQK